MLSIIIHNHGVSVILYQQKMTLMAGFIFVQGITTTTLRFARWKKTKYKYMYIRLTSIRITQ